MNLVKRKEVVNITAEWLLDRLSVMQIYTQYVSDIVLHGKMKSPIRTDKHEGSWSIFESDGTILWKDFATEERGNVFHLVMKMYGDSYDKTLTRIATDMGLIDVSGQDMGKRVIPGNSDRVPTVKKAALIQVTAVRWSDRTLGYWQQFGINREQLDREQIYPVREWYLNRVRQPIYDGELCYCYRYPGSTPDEDKFKLYYPMRGKGEKWPASNISTRVVEGLDRLNGHEKVVVCKSRKDRCTLEQILPDTIGLISVQNESISAWTDDLLQILQGRQVWISYDSDSPGKQASRRVNEKHPWMRHVNVPDNYSPYKDWAEMYAAGMKEQIVEHFKNKQII